MDVSAAERGAFTFGPFLLDPLRRCLTRQGEPVKLTPTRFDTLLYLVANAGRLVEKDELLAAVWPGRSVEEANLTQTISTVRRALQEVEPGAEHYIATAPGRGYRFAEAVRRIEPSPRPPAANEPAAPGPLRLPARPDQPAVSAPPAAGRPRTRPAPLSRLALGLAAICAALGALLAWLAFSPSAAPFHPPPHSDAVTAFTNLNGNPEQDVFAEGMAEELIGTLARIDGVSVAGRLSAFSFKGRTVTIPDIARALNVRTVLEGSVERDGAKLRIRARLVDGLTGYQIWGQTYDRTLDDRLALQTDIAAGVAAALAVPLLGGDAQRLMAGRTSNARAFDAYLRATGLVRFYTKASLQAALSAYEDAIRADPRFANAYAGHAIAEARIANTWTQDGQARQAALRQALEEAGRAVAIAPASAEAHAARAIILQVLLSFREAEAEIRRAQALGPGILEVERIYARIEMDVGHTAEAVDAARHLVALDPLTSGVYYWLAAAQIMDCRYEQALATLQTESALGAADPDRSATLKATAHLAEGMPEAAVADCRSACTAEAHGFDLLAIAYARLGRQDEARQAFARQREADGYQTLDAAEVYANWGDLRNAVRVLQASYTAHDPDLTDLKADPLLDPLRATPEYRHLVSLLDYPP